MIWFQFALVLVWWLVFVVGGFAIARQSDEPIWDRTWSIAAWLLWPVVVPWLCVAGLLRKKRMKWDG